MEFSYYIEFKNRIFRDFKKHKYFLDSHDDVFQKTEELYLKLKDDEKYTYKSIYIVCLLISNKYIMDIPINNKSFSKIYFIDVQKLKTMELYFLDKLNWKI